MRTRNRLYIIIEVLTNIQKVLTLKFRIIGAGRLLTPEKNSIQDKFVPPTPFI